MLDVSLKPFLQGLAGAKLVSAKVGAGEIFVDFEQPDGTWSLGTAGSEWLLVKDDEPVVSYQDDESEIDRFGVAVGRHVDAVYPGKGGSGLRVDLGDGVAFLIMRSQVGVADELPVFELFRPHHRVILLHRDGSVDDVPSDAPIPELVASGQLHHWRQTQPMVKPRSHPGAALRLAEERNALIDKQRRKS